MYPGFLYGYECEKGNLNTRFPYSIVGRGLAPAEM